MDNVSGQSRIGPAHATFSQWHPRFTSTVEKIGAILLVRYRIIHYPLTSVSDRDNDTFGLGS